MSDAKKMAEALELIAGIAEDNLPTQPTIRWRIRLWELCIPGEPPCNCDSFEDAVEGMREWLSHPARRKKYDPFATPRKS